MKRYQIALILVVALVPLGLLGYKRIRFTDIPLVSGATYWVEQSGDGQSFDLHVKVFGTKSDSCFTADRAKVSYDQGNRQRAAAITVVPELQKSRFAGDCEPLEPFSVEGVLRKVPAGSYSLSVIGSGRILLRDIAVPGKGNLPEYFTPPEVVAQGAPKAP